jgi:secretion/DNA translocation related TadE-like protein
VRGERGSVSIVAIGLMVLTIVLAMGGADVAKALIAQARAQTAADAAALAAVQELALPSGLVPGDLAADYAGRNDATLVSCTCEPGTAEAVVEVHVPVGTLLLFADDRIVTGRARAIVEPMGG